MRVKVDIETKGGLEAALSRMPVVESHTDVWDDGVVVRSPDERQMEHVRDEITIIAERMDKATCRRRLRRIANEIGEEALGKRKAIEA